MEEYYGPTGCNSNVHRGVHNLSSRATAAYEEARDKIANFIHARTSREIVFVKNASEGINLIANTWGNANIKQGDEVSVMSKRLFTKCSMRWIDQTLSVNHKLTSALHADYSVSSRASQQPGAMAHAGCKDRCKAAFRSTDQRWHRTGHGGTPESPIQEPCHVCLVLYAMTQPMLPCCWCMQPIAVSSCQDQGLRHLLHVACHIMLVVADIKMLFLRLAFCAICTRTCAISGHVAGVSQFGQPQDQAHILGACVQRVGNHFVH